MRYQHCEMVSPAGAVAAEVIDAAAERLRSWGLQVDIAPHAKGQYRGFAGTPQERAEDLVAAFENQDIDVVVCNRGGYGVVQIIDQLRAALDQQAEAGGEQQKLLVGYSDITVLHNLLGNRGRHSLHAIMARHIADLPAQEEALVILRQILQGQRSISYALDPHPLNRTGEAEGLLMGGNLCVFSNLHGTPYDLPQDADILFIEDIGEYAHYIDRYMYNLRLAGTLDRIKGLIVGQFTDCKEDPRVAPSIYESIREVCEPYSFPILFNYPAGHVEHNLPLMMHAQTQLNVREDGCIFEQQW